MLVSTLYAAYAGPVRHYVPLCGAGQQQGVHLQVHLILETHLLGLGQTKSMAHY